MSAPTRRVILGLAALAVVVGAGLGVDHLRAQQRPDVQKKEPLADFMDRKLDHAQQALAGLSRHDLPAVAEQADKLGLICIDVNWNVIQSDEYVERSTAFRRTIAALAKAARADKLEGAELAYLDLVGQCFSCHDYVRDRKKAK